MTENQRIKMRYSRSQDYSEGEGNAEGNMGKLYLGPASELKV